MKTTFHSNHPSPSCILCCLCAEPAAIKAPEQPRDQSTKTSTTLYLSTRRRSRLRRYGMVTELKKRTGHLNVNRLAKFRESIFN